MNRFSFFILFFLFVFIINDTYSKENSRYNTEFYNSGNSSYVTEIIPADISATISGTISVCQHTTNPDITFTGSGGTAPYTFTYTINGGPDLNVTSASGSNSATVSVSTDNAGVYIYTITNVSDNASNTQQLSDQATVTVNALPVIDFRVTDLQCSGTGVLFTPTLTGNYSYAWDFGDGTTSTKVTPTHLFTASGISTQDYVVKLTQTDITTSCQDTISKHVIVTQVPDATLNGSGYDLTYNGLSGFRICSNDSTATFTFSNASITADTNTNYSINWGDGTADFTDTLQWNLTNHTYKAGLWSLTYTVKGPNGCISVKKYYVFVGSTPTFTLGNLGSLNICISQTFTFQIITDNNTKGTTYTVSYNDGTKDEVYTSVPPPITHKFLKSSCGVNFKNDSTLYQNSFYVKITASNPCGIYVIPIMPISVSGPPTADFILPETITCLNTPIRLINSSLINKSTCSSSSNLIWHITPETGYTLQSNSRLGNDYGSTDPNIWSPGSDSIWVVFTKSQPYIISMKIGNSCGINSTSKTICVASPLIPQFNLSSTGGCTPFNVNITNKTDTTQSCSSTFKWKIKYTAKYCGTTSGYTFTSGNESSSNPSFQFTNPGIYRIQLMATNSCGPDSTYQDITVTGPPEVSIDSIPGFCGLASVHPVAHVTSCAPASDILSYAWSFTGGSPDSPDSLTSLDPGVITYNSTGVYTASLTVTNSCGIPVKALRTFAVKPVPILTDTVLDQTICSGFKPDSVKLTSDLPSVTYLWTATATPGITGYISSGTTPFLPTVPIFNSNTSQGTVTYTITPSLNGCTGDTVDYAIKVNPAPIIWSQPKSFDICVGGIPDTLSVAAKNGLGTPTFQWYRNTVNDNTTGDPIAGALNATYVPPTGIADTMYYYCVVTYPTGQCPSIQSETAQVSVNAYPVISNYSLVLNSGDTFTFSPNTLNGDIIPAEMKFTWSLPGLNPLNSITGATSQLTPQVVLKQTLTSSTVTPATATYTVTPTNGKCNGKDFNLTVTVIHPLNPNIIQKNISCFGDHDGSLKTAIEGGVPFNTGNPYHVTWTGPYGFASTNDSITGLYKGNYTLVIKDSIDSVFTKIYVITEPSELNLRTVTTKNVSCFGSADGEITVQVTGGTPPYTYTWEKDATSFPGSEDIKNLGPGIYTVTVTDSLNCGPKVFSDTITEKPGMILKLINQSNLKCYGDSAGAISVDVSGGKPFVKSPGVLYYDYSWAGPNGYTSTDQNLTHLAGGIYTLSVTDSTGCHQTLEVTITQPTEIIINAQINQITCYGDNNASITLEITGGIKPYQIKWSNLGKGLVQNNLSPGTYTVDVTDSAGCQKTKDYVIGETKFSIQPVVKNITCFGAHNGSINLNISGSTAIVSLVWDDDPTVGATRNQLGPGVYNVTLRDTSACVIIQSFTILEPPAIVVAAAITNAFDCSNPNSGAIALTITGGTQPYHVVWSNGETTNNLSAIQAGTYVATVTDSLGCNVTKNFVVMRPDPIVLSIDTVPDFNCQTKVLTEICTAKITGGIPPFRCNWSSGTPDALNNEIMRTTQSGMIVLTVVDGQGCTATFTFSVSIPDAGIDEQLVNCNNRVIAFTATVPSGVAGDYTFLWNFGDGKTETIQNPQHTFTTSGTYNVSLTMTNANCTVVYEKTITVEPTPVLVLDKLPVFCTGDSLLLHVSGADTYQWSNGSTGDSTLIKQTGDYFVAGTSKAGCTATLSFKATNFDSYNFTIQTDKAEVTTVDPTLQLWSQSITFSDYFWDFGDGSTAVGNNQTHTYNILKDGYYDVKLKVQNPNGCIEFATKRIWITNTSTGNVFTPNGDGVDDIFMKGWHIQVYNRNGILIYEGTEGWDGTYKGKPVSNDTYFYVLYVSGASGVKTRTGFVTVVR